MTVPWEALPHIKSFLQLDFLFSGLEVSSATIFAARIGTFLILATAVGFGSFRIIIKILDVFQTFLRTVTRLPKSFFLLLILVIPLSSDSLGAKWSGYIVLAMCLATLAILGALLLIVWKYGVDQALRLVDRIRNRGADSDKSCRESLMPPENSYGPLVNPPAA